MELMKKVVIDKVKLNNGETYGFRYYKGGNKNILLIHGNMTSSKHFDTLIDALPENYTIYAVDMRGFGISTYINPINSLEDLADDIFLFTQKIGLDKFDILGWSTGGGVAMVFAARHSEKVNKMFLVDSVGIQGYPIYAKDEQGKPIFSELLLNRDEIASDTVQVAPVLTALEMKDKEYYRALWNTTIYTQNQPDTDKYEEYLEDNFTQRNLLDIYYALTKFNISNEFNGHRKGSGEVYNIKADTLILQGDKDLVVPFKMAEGIKDALGEKGTLKILKNCGHSPFVDCLDKLVNIIVDF